MHAPRAPAPTGRRRPRPRRSATRSRCGSAQIAHGSRLSRLPHSAAGLHRCAPPRPAPRPAAACAPPAAAAASAPRAGRCAAPCPAASPAGRSVARSRAAHGRVRSVHRMRHQNGSFIPGGRLQAAGRPSASPPRPRPRPCCRASACAATIRSSSISASAGSTTFGSILIRRISPLPLSVTRHEAGAGLALDLHALQLAPASPPSSSASAGPASSGRRGSSFVKSPILVGGFASSAGVASVRRQAVGVRRGVMHRVDPRAGKRVQDRAHQRMVGRGAAPRGVGGAALLGQRRLARGGRQRDRPARAGRLASAARPRRAARSRGASGCGRSSITGGAKRTRCTEWIRCACSIASRRSATRRGDVAEARPAAARVRAPATGAPPATARAPPPPPTACRRRRCRRRAGVAHARRQPPHQIAGRRQVGDVAEPDQHHLGGGAPVGRGLHLADALQQHLPGARQHRHRQLLGQRRAARALGLRQLGTVAQRRDRLQPGHACASAPADPAAARRDRRRARARGR